MIIAFRLAIATMDMAHPLISSPISEEGVQVPLILSFLNFDQDVEIYHVLLLG